MNVVNMLRKISLLLLLAFVGITMSAQSLKWYNPQEAGFHVLQGQAFEGDVRKRFYDRLPIRAKETVRKAVWSISRQTAGESICFSTDSKNIKVR